MENKKIKISTLIFSVFFAFLLVLSSLSIPKVAHNVYATSSFDGNSLAGTTWLIDLEPEKPNSTIEASINFTSNNQNFTSISMPHRSNTWYECAIMYSVGQVYDASSGWFEEGYRTITIASESPGTDAVNGGTYFEALRTWLNANATLQPSGGGSGASETGVAENIAFASAAIVALTVLLVVVSKKQKNMITK